jgi:hypothetical protein
MSTTEQDEMRDRVETLLQDADLRRQQQGGTFYQHGLAQADEINQGRFAATGSLRVVGSTPTLASQYPACSPALAVQLPDEPPLSAYENPAIENRTGSSSVSTPVATGAPAAESSSSACALTDDVEPGAGAPPSNKRGE